MGKVLSRFTNGYPGAISRAVDDVVIALPNKYGTPIAFGQPVVLTSDGTGVLPFTSSNTADQFLGVAVRNPSKTPSTYGSNTGSYASDELVDVLVRGHVTVYMPNDNNVRVGNVVSIIKSNGAFSVSTGDAVVPLTNAHVSAGIDGNNCVEIVLNSRNVI